MTALQAAWMASVLAFGWFLTIGVIRMVAYRSGQVDHTRGMRNVAVLALSLAAVAAICMIILTFVIVNE